MKDFYEKYNFTQQCFASISGVSKNTLIKFANGEKIRESSKERIEKAMRIAEKYNLIRPKYDRGEALLSDTIYKRVYHYEIHLYEREYLDG